MDTDPFVRPDSIVRRIWGDAPLYPALRRAGRRPLVRRLLVPPAHLAGVRRLDGVPGGRGFRR